MALFFLFFLLFEYNSNLTRPVGLWSFTANEILSPLLVVNFLSTTGIFLMTWKLTLVLVSYSCSCSLLPMTVCSNIPNFSLDSFLTLTEHLSLMTAIVSSCVPSNKFLLLEKVVDEDSSSFLGFFSCSSSSPFAFLFKPLREETIQNYSKHSWLLPLFSLYTFLLHNNSAVNPLCPLFGMGRWILRLFRDNLFVGGGMNNIDIRCKEKETVNIFKLHFFCNLYLFRI